MSERTVSEPSIDQGPTERKQGSGQTSSEGTTSKLSSYARRGIESGVVAGVLGGLVTLQGLRALRRGDRGGGFVRLFFGGLLTGVAARQRRTASGQSGESTAHEGDAGAQSSSHGGGGTSVEPSATEIQDDSEEKEPELGGTAVESAESDEIETGEGEVGETEIDETQTGETGIDETEADEAETGETEVEEQEGYSRMGEVAFDEQSGRVPAPQRAFDLGYLVLNGEAHWGIRETDGVVVVSQLYDPMADGDDVRYVASSEVDGERMLKIPDTVLDHWEEAVDGAVAVESGDDVVFVKGGELEADNQLAVVPEKWSDEMFGEEA